MATVMMMMTRMMCTHPDAGEAEVLPHAAAAAAVSLELPRGCVQAKLCYSQVFSASVANKCEGVIHMIALNFFSRSSGGENIRLPPTGRGRRVGGGCLGLEGVQKDIVTLLRLLFLVQGVGNIN